MDGYRTLLLTATVFLWNVFGSSAGEAENVYTLNDCIRIGLERNESVANARRDKAIAVARIGQARSAALPQLSLSATYTRLDELQTIEFGDEEMKLGTLDNYSANLGVSQLLYSGGKVGAALRAASLAESQAEWACSEIESAFKRDVRLAFYNLLLADAALSVTEDSVKQLESLLEQTERRRKNGTASEFDELRARVRVANERPRLVKARNARAVAREYMKRLLNFDDKEIELRGELEMNASEPDEEYLQGRAMLNRPALRAMEFSVDLRKENVTAARSDGLPSLSAQFNYNGANAYEFVSYEDDWDWHWNAGLVVSWNFWDGGLTEATVRARRLEAEKALASLDEMRKNVKLEVKRYCLDLKHAREAVAASRGTVALAEKAMKIAETRHEEGLATYLEFTDANLALSTAKLTWLQALHAHMTALAQLQFACGTEKLSAEAWNRGKNDDR